MQVGERVLSKSAACISYLSLEEQSKKDGMLTYAKTIRKIHSMREMSFLLW